MWPRRFFTARFFAPRYFPSGIGVPSTPFGGVYWFATVQINMADYEVARISRAKTLEVER